MLVIIKWDGVWPRFIRARNSTLKYKSWICCFSEETVSFGIYNSVKTTKKRPVEKRLIKVRSGSSKFCVHLGSWPLNLRQFSDAHRWWRGCGGCGKRAVSQGTEAVRLKTGKGVSNRIVSARDVSSRECKVVFERLTCDCSNEVNYLGGLEVFRVYDGNQTCCHITCGFFYQTSGDPIQYEPNIWEIAPAIEYWYPFFGWAHVVGKKGEYSTQFWGVFLGNDPNGV